MSRTAVEIPPEVLEVLALPAASLTYAHYSGWACCWCGKSLLDITGAQSTGLARGRSGAHVLDNEVYACPTCTGQSSPRPSKPAHQRGTP
ncbi:hypothetical protein ACFC09_32170 [Streptomyces sp. NPDC056161]|uniref:hypothetical protein n=1 Tax=Streptomyces sp. NPDC056161 TaxID=3345732 RepID=UPI0035D8CF06